MQTRTSIFIKRNNLNVRTLSTINTYKYIWSDCGYITAHVSTEIDIPMDIGILSTR